MASEENKTIAQLASIPRPGYGDKKGEELRIELCEYSGKPYLSLRLWFHGNEDKWLPSKKGMSIRLGELQAVKEALGGHQLGVLLKKYGTSAPAKAKTVAKEELFEGEGSEPPANDPF